MGNKIAVIIPCYNAHDTIVNTLHSIAMQRHSDFSVYLVVDGEPVGSYDYLTAVHPVTVWYLPVNAGPGHARQYGIDHTTEPFITFVDADDTLLSTLALYYQQLPFKEDKIALVSTAFLQENKDHTLKLHDNDMVWMHGKMYRRGFLERYNIRFNDTRSNEDVGVNTQCQCLANENEQIYLSHDVTYMWQWRDGSTVRLDNASYTYNESVEGYVLNKIYAFDNVLKHGGINDAVKYFIVGAMVHLFKKYLGAMLKMPKQLRHIKKWSRKYYLKLFKLVDAEYLEKAERTILAHNGLTQPEHYDEFVKWKKLLNDTR